MLLKDVATVHTGLVLSRRMSIDEGSSGQRFKTLTLRSVDEEEGLLEEELDTNLFSHIPQEHLTREGDVVVRLSSPNTAAYISSAFEGLVIPSQFCVVRVNSDELLPEYLAWYLGSAYVKRQIHRDLYGSTVSTIRKGTLESIEIDYVSIEEQERILRIDELQRRERGLLKKLAREKETLYKGMIHKIISDGR